MAEGKFPVVVQENLIQLDHDGDQPAVTYGINRRSLLVGAAWSVPVVAATLSVPIAAATGGDPGEPVNGIVPLPGSFRLEGNVDNLISELSTDDLLKFSSAGYAQGPDASSQLTYIVTFAVLRMSDGESYQATTPLSGSGVTGATHSLPPIAFPNVRMVNPGNRPGTVKHLRYPVSLQIHLDVSIDGVSSGWALLAWQLNPRPAALLEAAGVTEIAFRGSASSV